MPAPLNPGAAAFTPKVAIQNGTTVPRSPIVARTPSSIATPSSGSTDKPNMKLDISALSNPLADDVSQLRQAPPKPEQTAPDVDQEPLKSEEHSNYYAWMCGRSDDWLKENDTIMKMHKYLFDKKVAAEKESEKYKKEFKDLQIAHNAVRRELDMVRNQQLNKCITPPTDEAIELGPVVVNKASQTTE